MRTTRTLCYYALILVVTMPLFVDNFFAKLMLVPMRTAACANYPHPVLLCVTKNKLAESVAHGLSLGRTQGLVSRGTLSGLNEWLHPLTTPEIGTLVFISLPV